jgi:hypothetical protein
MSGVKHSGNTASTTASATVGRVVATLRQSSTTVFR